MRNSLETFEQFGADMPSESLVPIAIPMRLDHHFPDSVITRFASEVSVQIDRGGFYICFFEVVPPVLTGTQEENRARLEKMESIRAECVARVFIPSYKLPDVLTLVQNAVSQSALLPSPATTDDTESEGS